MAAESMNTVNTQTIQHQKNVLCRTPPDPIGPWEFINNCCRKHKHSEHTDDSTPKKCALPNPSHPIGPKSGVADPIRKLSGQLIPWEFINNGCRKHEHSEHTDNSTRKKCALPNPLPPDRSMGIY